MKTAKQNNQPIQVRRRVTVRFEGVATAAARLHVSKQAVSNYVSGRCKSSLSRDKAALIEIVDA